MMIYKQDRQTLALQHGSTAFNNIYITAFIACIHIFAVDGAKKDIMDKTNDPFIDMCVYGDSNAFFIITQFSSREYASLNSNCVVNGVLIIPTVLLNSILVLTIWKSSNLKAKLPYFMILMQSIVDLAVGTISLPLYIAMAALELRGNASCVDFVILQAVSFIPIGSSFMTIYLLTYERYLSILHPILHRVYLTKARMSVCFCCAILWVTVTGVAMRIMWENIFSTFHAATISVFLAINTFAYVRMYFAVKNTSFQSDRIGDNSTEESSSKRRKSLRERNLAKSCALVVLISYFCYIPFLVCYFYFRNDPIKFKTALYWCTTVATLNSCFNSLVFFWKRPLLREEAIKLLRKVCSE